MRPSASHHWWFWVSQRERPPLLAWQSWRQQAIPKGVPLHLPAWDPGLLRIRQNCSSWSGPPEGPLRCPAQGCKSITRSPWKQGTMNPSATVQIWPGGHSPPLTQPEDGAPSPWAARLRWSSHQWEHSEDDPRSGLGQAGLFRWLSGTEPACSVGAASAVVQSLGCQDPLEEGAATHSSVLAWPFSWAEGPAGLQSTGSRRARHDWSRWASTHLGRSCSDSGQFGPAWGQRRGVGPTSAPVEVTGDTATDLCSAWGWPRGAGPHRAPLGTQRRPFREGRPREGPPRMRSTGPQPRLQPPSHIDRLLGLHLSSQEQMLQLAVTGFSLGFLAVVCLLAFCFWYGRHFEKLYDIWEMHRAWNEARPGLTSWLGHWLVLWPWASYFAALTFRFLICEMRKTKSYFQSGWQDRNEYTWESEQVVTKYRKMRLTPITATAQHTPRYAFKSSQSPKTFAKGASGL